MSSSCHMCTAVLTLQNSLRDGLHVWFIECWFACMWSCGPLQTQGIHVRVLLWIVGAANAAILMSVLVISAS